MERSDNSAIDKQKLIFKAMKFDINAIERIYNDPYGQMNTFILFLLVVLMIISYPLYVTTFFFARHIIIVFSFSCVIFLSTQKNIFNSLRIYISIMPIALFLEVILSLLSTSEIIQIPTGIVIADLFGYSLPFFISVTIFDCYYVSFNAICILNNVYTNIPFSGNLAKGILIMVTSVVAIILSSFLVWLLNPIFIAFSVLILLCLFTLVNML